MIVLETDEECDVVRMLLEDYMVDHQPNDTYFQSGMRVLLRLREWFNMETDDVRKLIDQ